MKNSRERLTGLAALAAITLATTSCAVGKLTYKNTDIAKEDTNEVRMWSGNSLSPRVIREEDYAIKRASEDKIAEVNGEKINITNSRYLIPINDSGTEEVLRPNSNTIENKKTRYFLTPVEEDENGSLRIAKGEHNLSDMVLEKHENVCPNQIAKYKRDSTYVSQRTIEGSIRNFPELNHGDEDFNVFEIEQDYITEADKKSLGFGEDYRFGEDILPIIFIRGKLTPELVINHRNNGKVDLTKRIYGKQFLLIKGKMINKPKDFSPEEKENKLESHE